MDALFLINRLQKNIEIYKPLIIEINEEQQVDIDKILERLEDDEDVQKVYTNLA